MLLFPSVFNFSESLPLFEKLDLVRDVEIAIQQQMLGMGCVGDFISTPNCLVTMKNSSLKAFVQSLLNYFVTLRLVA